MDTIREWLAARRRKPVESAEWAAEYGRRIGALREAQDEARALVWTLHVLANHPAVDAGATCPGCVAEAPELAESVGGVTGLPIEWEDEA